MRAFLQQWRGSRGWSAPSATVFCLVAGEVRLALHVLDEWLAVKLRTGIEYTILAACCPLLSADRRLYYCFSGHSESSHTRTGKTLRKPYFPQLVKLGDLLDPRDRPVRSEERLPPYRLAPWKGS
jgi:hypothetical protein